MIYEISLQHYDLNKGDIIFSRKINAQDIESALFKYTELFDKYKELAKEYKYESDCHMFYHNEFNRNVVTSLCIFKKPK